MSIAPILPGQSGPAARPEIVGHRGAAHDAPENTLASVCLAWAQQADAAEVDVYLTRDKSVVCMHDKELKRTTGAPGTVEEATLGDLLQLEAGAWKGSEWAGEPIPLLGHVLASIPEGRRLFVEIKGGPEIVPYLVKLVANSGKAPEQIVFISFKAESCAAVKEALPAHRVFLLSGFKEDEAGMMRPTIPELIAQAKALGVDGVDVSRKGPLTRDAVEAIHAAGLFLAVYTVDDPAEAHELFARGVDSITTNKPGAMLASFERR